MIRDALTWITIVICGLSVIFSIIVSIFLYFHLCFSECRCLKNKETSIELSVASSSPHSYTDDNKEITNDLTGQSTSSKIKKHKNKNKVSIKPYFRWTTILAITCFTISSILCFKYLLDLILKYDSIYFDIITENKNSKLMAMGNIFAIIARIVILILLNGRLYYTFKGTMYKINKYVFYILNGIIMVIPILIIIILFVPHNLKNVVFLSILLFLMINISILLYCFNQRLMKLTISSTLNDMNKNKEIKLAKSEEKLIELVTRNTLLMILVIIIGNIPSMFGVYLTIKGITSFTEFCYLALIALPLQLFNTICISLLYHFCDQYYYILCKCSKCKIKCFQKYWGHNCCLNICIGIAKKTILQKHSESNIDNKCIKHENHETVDVEITGNVPNIQIPDHESYAMPTESEQNVQYNNPSILKEEKSFRSIAGIRIDPPDV